MMTRETRETRETRAPSRRAAPRASMSEPHPADETLVGRLAASPPDEAALATLLERWWRRSHRLAVSLVGGDPAAAEDVTQETFIRVLRAAERFDVDRAFRPWLFQIVRRVAADHRRAAGRRAGHEAAAAAPERIVGAPDGDAAAHEEAALVADHLDRLSPTYRDALALRYVEELSIAECAAVLDCPEGTVSSRVRRGLEELRRSLEPVLGVGAAIGAELIARAGDAAPTPAVPAAAGLLARATGAPGSSAAPPARTGAGASLALAGLVALLVAGGLGALLIPPGPKTTSGAGRVGATGGRPVDSPGTTDASSPGAADEDDPVADKPGSSSGPETASADGSGEATDANATIVHGVLLIGAGGRPVAGERVVLTPERSEQDAALVATTDAAGAFSFAVPADRRRVSLEIGPEGSNGAVFTARLDGEPLPMNTERTFGFVQLEQPFALPDGPRATLELRLAELRVEGAVLARSSGRPVPGARVATLGGTATTASDGTFRLATPKRAWLIGPRLSVDAPGFATAGALLTDVSLEPKDEQVTGLVVKLEDGIDVDGIVIDDAGLPMADVLVSAQGMIPSQNGPAGSSFGWAWTARTGDDGRFVLRGLPGSSPDAPAGTTRLDLAADPGNPESDPGHEALLAALEQWIPYREKAALLDPDERLVIRIAARNAGIRGRVVGPDGEGIAGAAVVLLDDAAVLGWERFLLHFEQDERVLGDQILGRWLRRSSTPLGETRTTADGGVVVTTDAKGRFAVRDLPPGRRRFLVAARGFADRTIQRGVPAERPVEVRLARGAVITGRVVTTDGRGVPSVIVYAFPRGTIQALGAGQRVVTSGEGGPRMLERTPTREILARRGPAPFAAACSDADGRFSIERLPTDGSYDIAASAASAFIFGELKVELGVRSVENVRAGSAVGDLAFEPLRWATVRVRPVAAETGEPLAEAAVRVRDPSGDLWSWFPPTDGVAPLDETGARTLRVPTRGRLTLELVASGRRTAIRPLDAIQDGEVDLGSVPLEQGGATLTVAIRYPARPPASILLFVDDPGTGLRTRHELTPKPGRTDEIDIGPLGAGEARVELVWRETADGPLLGLAPRAVEVAPDETARVELTVTGTRRWTP